MLVFFCSFLLYFFSSISVYLRVSSALDNVYCSSSQAMRCGLVSHVNAVERSIGTQQKGARRSNARFFLYFMFLLRGYSFSCYTPLAVETQMSRKPCSRNSHHIVRGSNVPFERASWMNKKHVEKQHNQPT